MRITIDQFLTILNEKCHGAACFGVVTTRTFPPLLVKSRADKTPCPFPDGVERMTERSVCLGAIYSNSVNRQREKEGHPDFFIVDGLWKSKEYPEGAGKKDGPYTVIHQGSLKRYLAMRPCTDKDNVPVILNERWIDLATMTEIAEPTAYLREPSKAISQDVERIVHWRCVELSNVVQARTLGNIYDIIR